MVACRNNRISRSQLHIAAEFRQSSDPITCTSPNRNPAAIKAAIHFTVCSVFLAPFFTPCATFLTPFFVPCSVLFAVFLVP